MAENNLTAVVAAKAEDILVVWVAVNAVNKREIDSDSDFEKIAIADCTVRFALNFEEN